MKRNDKRHVDIEHEDHVENRNYKNEILLK